ncbi:MAG TPA: hypothetical protein VJM69_04875 [Dehalococcoidia bacterium]|nr:hypothetical protein [Dehalococcoidia bacterium]
MATGTLRVIRRRIRSIENRGAPPQAKACGIEGLCDAPAFRLGSGGFP